MRISATWEGQGLELLQGGIKRATLRALRKAGTIALREMKKEGKAEVRSRKKLKVSRINRALSTSKKLGNTFESLEWRLEIAPQKTPLIDYPNAQTKDGIRVTINAGKRVSLRGAFVATMKSGHRGIFVRDGKSRLPIHELYSTRVFDVFKNPEVIPAVTREAMSELTKSFALRLPIEMAKEAIKKALK